MIVVKRIAFDVQKLLREWAVNYNIHHNALSALLKGLQRHPCFTFLPSDSRTLLKTERKITSREVPPGEYVHFGLLNGIKKAIDQETYRNNIVELAVSVDGLPISKSSHTSLWPILGSLIPFASVFIIGIYAGIEKPTDSNEFLKEFINEAIHLSKNGIDHNNKHYDFLIKHIICDAPAKSFILQVKGHAGYSSCTKCTTEGLYLNKRMCFPALQFQQRTDENFRNRTDEDYHIGQTRLLEIPNVGLVTNVCLDYMHLVCLGVVRKMLQMWTLGDLSYRLPSKKIQQISERLCSMKNMVPNEFSRKPRAIKYLKLWKATEYRQFLLYSGPYVLKGILSNDYYHNFLTLHFAIRILCSSKFFHLLDYAEQLLKYFVHSFIILYGEESVSHNVHNLLHLVQEVRNFGTLDGFSAFKFENYMKTIKRNLRKAEKPLQQIYLRYMEADENYRKTQKEQYKGDHYRPVLSSEHHAGPLLDSYVNPQYKAISNNCAMVHVDKTADSCCGLSDGSIIRIYNIAHTHKEEIVVIGKRFTIKEELYSVPCAASTLEIYLVSEESELCVWPLKTVVSKYMMFVTSNGLHCAISLL